MAFRIAGNRPPEVFPIAGGTTISLIPQGTFTFDPAVGNTLAADSFETGDLTFVNTNFDWTDTKAVANGEDSYVAVETTLARSLTHSLRFQFGAAADGNDSWAEQRWSFGPNFTEIWIRWYQYFLDGTEGLGAEWQHRTQASGGNNNKMLRLWDDDYQLYRLKLGFSFRTDVSVSGDSSIIAEFGTNQNGVGTFGLPVAQDIITDSTRGIWNEVVAHAKVDDGGSNGILQMLFNSTLIHNHQGIDMFPLNGGGNYFANGYLMGWANSGFDNTSSTFIDDLEIASSNIWGVG